MSTSKSKTKRQSAQAAPTETVTLGELAVYAKTRDQLSRLKQKEMTDRLSLVNKILRINKVPAGDKVNLEVDIVSDDSNERIATVKITRGILINFHQDEYELAPKKIRKKITDKDKACFENKIVLNKTKLGKLPANSVLNTFITEKPASPILTVTIVK